MNKNDQISCTRFLANYFGLTCYDVDMKNIYTIDHKYICLVKKHGYGLFVDPNQLDGTLTYHEYFFIHYDFLTEF